MSPANPTPSLTLDRAGCQTLRADLDAALAEVAKRHGVQLKLGRCTYAPDGSNATFKLEAARLTDGGTAMTREASDLNRHGAMFGLPSNALGRTFTSRGERYTITGLSLRARRYPVLATRESDGRSVKWPAESVANALAAEEAVDQMRAHREGK